MYACKNKSGVLHTQRERERWGRKRTLLSVELSAVALGTSLSDKVSRRLKKVPLKSSRTEKCNLVETSASTEFVVVDSIYIL